MATDHQHQQSSHGDDGAGPLNHETTDIPLEGVGKLGIGVILVLLMISGAMYVTFRVLDRRGRAAQAPVSKINADRPVVDPAGMPLMEAPNVAEQRGRPPAGPKLLTDEGLWLRDLRAAEATTATTYGWVNKEAGVVRVPIERAKQLILEAGLPATEAPATASDPDAAATDGSAAPAAPSPPAGQ